MKRPALLLVVVLSILGASAVVVGMQTSGIDSSGGETDQRDRLTLDGESPIALERPAPTVTGTTDLEAGREIRVTVESSDSGNNQPFTTRERATVGEQGTFTAEFSLATIQPGTDATVRVHTADTGEFLGKRTAVVSVPWATVQSDGTLVGTDGEEITSVSDAVTIRSPEPHDPPYSNGATVPIEISLDGPDVATVTVGSLTQQNVRFTATVRDDNDSGNATVLFDTAALDGDNDGFTTGEGTTLLRTASEFEGGVEEIGLAPGGYDLSVASGNRPHYDERGLLADHSMLLLEPANESR